MPLTATMTDAAWEERLHRWDAMQAAYLPDREARFSLMLDVLEVLLPAEFVALDLACGPGAISQRLLGRFPSARCVAVDLDPILLAMGQSVLGDQGGRLRWAEASLLDPSWPSLLGETQFDAALSTTALHWLPNDGLVRVYGQLGHLLRLGGVFLNGDHLPFGPHEPHLQQVADTLKERRHAQSFAAAGSEDWSTWWDSLKADPTLRELLAEREGRFTWRPDDEQLSGVDLHIAALRAAGFREVDTLWQNLDNRVLVAVR